MTEARFSYLDRDIEFFDPLVERHPSWEQPGGRWKKNDWHGVKKYIVTVPPESADRTGVFAVFAVDLGKELKQGYLGKTFEIVARPGQSAVLVVFNTFTWDGSTCSLDWTSKFASLVHDALCIAANSGYKMDYEWKQRIYRDILRMQGFPSAWAYMRYVGLLAFNWI
jgi:hypothetical protein